MLNDVSNIRPELLDNARAILSKLHISLDNHNVFFVYIRRGDYLTWPTIEFPAVISSQWITLAMEIVRSRCPDTVFLIFGKDVKYNRNLVGLIPNSHALAFSKELDFAIMSLYIGCILSPSTFAWWTNYYC